MKKFTFIVAALAIVVAFTSCHKEGNYKPSKKIDRIYTEGKSSSKTLDQVWTWDGNKLKSIDYYSSGSIDYTDNFTYKNGRITRIDDYKNSEYTEFTYNNGKLTRATRYYKGQLREEFSFSYQNNKISSVYETYYSSSNKSNDRLNSNANPLRYILPEIADNTLKNINKKQAESKGTSTCTIKIEWDGNNVSSFKVSGNGWYDEVKYEYDNKKNPFYGLLDMYLEEGQQNFSKNNITKLIMTYNETGYSASMTGTLQYTYDGSYPATVRVFEEGEYEGTTYYEYK